MHPWILKGRIMNTWIQDLRYGARLLRKTPAFTIVAVVTLSVGIGANTAIFSIVDAVLLQPLAIRQPQRVMLLQEAWQGREGGGVSRGNFLDIHDQNTTFSSVSASASGAYNLATEVDTYRINGDNDIYVYIDTVLITPHN